MKGSNHFNDILCLAGTNQATVDKKCEAAQCGIAWDNYCEVKIL